MVRSLFLFLTLTVPPFLCSGVEAQSHSVGHVSKSFYDSSRAREIPIELYYPASYDGDQTPVEGWGHPMIVFGHGFLMEWQAYENLWQHFVPQGYIMAFPRTETGSSPDHGTFAKDMSFVADELQELNGDPSFILHNRLSQRWGLMGHSMGGGAAFLAASGDSSVATLIALAPAETTPSAIDSASSLEAPLLVFSGEQDGVTPPSDHHIPLYQAAASSCKNFISILGGAHCYFAQPNTYCDLGEANASSGISISRSEQQQTTYHFADPWMASVLQGDSSAFSSFEDRLMNSGSIAYQQDCSQDPTSLKDNEATPSALEIWPNPVKERLHLSLPSDRRIEELWIHTLQGQRVELHPGEDPRILELEGLEPGVHFLRIRLENGSHSISRFIKR